MNTNLPCDVQEIFSLLQSAGTFLLDMRQNEKMKIIHDPRSFKTEADRYMHELLSTKLAQLSPGVAIISEEDPVHRDDRPNAYWIIDPIDGTASWYEGFQGFVTQLAFVVAEKAVFGAVCAPALGKLWSAELGREAFLNGKAIKNVSQPRDQLVLIDNYPEPRGIAEFVCKQLGVETYIESGSLGLKSAFVADGTADIFVKTVAVRDWDIAPILPIIEATGGVVTLTDGTPYLLSGPLVKEKGVVVLSHPSLLSLIVTTVEQYRKRLTKEVC